jgi:hypothetical protein
MCIYNKKIHFARKWKKPPISRINQYALKLRRACVAAYLISPAQLRSDIHEGFVNGSHHTPPLCKTPQTLLSSS